MYLGGRDSSRRSGENLLTANPLPNVSEYAVFAIVAVFAMQV
jgi:hypothetical protein